MERVYTRSLPHTTQAPPVRPCDAQASTSANNSWWPWFSTWEAIAPAPALPINTSPPPLLFLQLRAQLKKAHSVDADTVECVYSSEEQVTQMLPLSKEQKSNPAEYGVVDNFR